MSPDVRIGYAGWSIATIHSKLFPTFGSHIERYGKVFPCTEINSCFHRSHRDVTYKRWAKSVPRSFKFAVKLSKAITHEKRLTDTRLLRPFISEVQSLGRKLGPLLVQLPPSLVFDSRLAGRFFGALRKYFPRLCRVRASSRDLVYTGSGKAARTAPGRTSGGRPGDHPQSGDAGRMGWAGVLPAAWIPAHLFFFLFGLVSSQASAGPSSKSRATSACLVHFR
jgi:hypothetical protein